MGDYSDGSDVAFLKSAAGIALIIVMVLPLLISVVSMAAGIGLSICWQP